MHSKCFNVRSKCACVCRHHLFCFRFFSDVSLINRSIWYSMFGTVLLMDMKILYHLGWLKHCHGILYQQARDFSSISNPRLMEASPVLKAMLDSSMQEGESRKIRLEDSCTRAVSLFLETLYLGTSGRVYQMDACDTPLTGRTPTFDGHGYLQVETHGILSNLI